MAAGDLVPDRAAGDGRGVSGSIQEECSNATTAPFRGPQQLFKAVNILSKAKPVSECFVPISRSENRFHRPGNTLFNRAPPSHKLHVIGLSRLSDPNFDLP